VSEEDATTRRAVADATPVLHATAEATRVLRELGTVVDAPDFILPWLDRIYDRHDAALVLAAAAGDLSGADPEVLDRAYRRAILDRDEAGAYSPADLHTRLELWAMFEGWKDVPLAVHRQLAEWEVDHYAATIRRDVESARAGRPNDSYAARYTYVLLPEAEAILSAQGRIYLWPCDCRAIVGKCRKPKNVCLRFENDRGVGWEISPERAMQVLRTTDKAGLMHTADYVGDPAAATSVCNCCTDCCYPHLAAERLDVGDSWPVRRHVARIDMDLCKSCGRCGLRCPFAAIVCRPDGLPTLVAALCRGCGLCQTGCSSDAIELLPLASE
jgi:Pyruvate/2-oxoacid:ferredoxin oxidoreductase delta subunit